MAVGRCYSGTSRNQVHKGVKMNLVQLSKAKFFLAVTLATLVGAVVCIQAVEAAPTVTVYKTPT